jgi:ADP-ribose pyrophosphatase YjhB (NUDIX family)
VSVIVTSELGVLLTRRLDGTTTFIEGPVEPGEQPAAAAVRVTREQVGLEVIADRTLGVSRLPLTAQEVTYLAARPSGGTDVRVSYWAGLADIRWASPAEADEAVRGMYPIEPVRQHLAHELFGGQP